MTRGPRILFSLLDLTKNVQRGRQKVRKSEWDIFRKDRTLCLNRCHADICHVANMFKFTWLVVDGIHYTSSLILFQISFTIFRLKWNMILFGMVYQLFLLNLNTKSSVSSSKISSKRMSDINTMEEIISNTTLDIVDQTSSNMTSDLGLGISSNMTSNTNTTSDDHSNVMERCSYKHLEYCHRYIKNVFVLYTGSGWSPWVPLISRSPVFKNVRAPDPL